MQTREQQRFRDFVAKHQTMVLHALSAWTGDTNLAEDLRSEVFVRVWKAWVRSKEDYAAKPRRWLYVIARNVAIDHRRKQRPQSEDLCESHGAVREGARLEAQLALGKVLLRTVDELPFQQRQVFELIFFEGHSLEETASRLGVPLNTVKSRQHRARLAVKQSLETQGVMPDGVEQPRSDRSKALVRPAE